MAVTLTLLDAVDATGAGTAYELVPLIGSGDAGVAQAVLTDTAEVDVEVSTDGTNWVSAGTDTEFSASGIASVVPLPRYVRGNCTAYTSGAVTLLLQLPAGWRAQALP